MIFVKLFTTLAIAPKNCEQSFLGFKPWYHYLPSTDFKGCDIIHFGTNGPSDIPLVLAAIIDDLLQIAGLVALAFIIIGAIKFITSEGNAESAANARSTIINALAGLAISISAILLINFIGTQVGR